MAPDFIASSSLVSGVRRALAARFDSLARLKQSRNAFCFLRWWRRCVVVRHASFDDASVLTDNSDLDAPAHRTSPHTTAAATTTEESTRRETSTHRIDTYAPACCAPPTHWARRFSLANSSCCGRPVRASRQLHTSYYFIFGAYFYSSRSGGG